MVEASQNQSTPERTQNTPESEKPRVQLELKSNSISSPPIKKQSQPSNEDENLNLLKQTVAQLESSEVGGENGSAAQNQIPGSAADAGSNAGSSAAETEQQKSRSEAQLFESTYQQLIQKVAELQKGTGQAAELSFEERAEALNALFTDRIIPLLNQVSTAAIEAQAQEQLYYQQTLEYQDRGAKAELIRQKQEQITREYTSQNKQFQERHIEIRNDEQAKREQINKNFDDHLNTIKAQMAEDVQKSREENEEIRKETTDLESKYEELQKECADKMELMNSQLTEQDGKQSSIEDTLTTQINSQAEELKKQVEAYKEQTKVKVEEEKQLIGVLKEYKAKYQEFQQATKSSKQNHKKFAKEVQALGNRKKNLEAEYGKLSIQLGILGEPDTASERIEEKVQEVAAMEQDWETQKQELLRQAETVKEECAQLQTQIKEQKEAAQAAQASQ